MAPTKPGRAPTPESPAEQHTGRGQRLPSDRGDTGEPELSYEEWTFNTDSRPRRYSISDDTILDSSETPQSRLETQGDQRRQRHRRDLYTDPDLYSGAIEGCSRDHHPECYPELQPRADSTTHHGDQGNRRGSPKRQPRSPSASSWEDTASSSEDDNVGRYRKRPIPNFSRKLLHRAGAATGPDRKGKGKGLPLTSEERRGVRPGRQRPEVTTEPSHPAQPPASPASSSTAAKITIEGFLAYPQITGYHNPIRDSSRPLFVVNPDAGSSVERIRGRATQRQKTLVRKRRGRSRSEAEAEAERSEGGRWFAKKLRRMLGD